MEYLSRSRLPVFTPRLDLTAEDLNAEAETLCAAINEMAGRLFIIKDMIPEEERAQYAEEQSYPILDEIKRIWEDIQRAWDTIAKNKEECEEHYQETLQLIAELDERLNNLIQAVKQELLDTINAVDKKHDDEEKRIEDKFDVSFSDLEKRFNALDDAAARKADVATLFDRIKYIQENSLPKIGNDGYWYIGKIKTTTLAQGPKGDKGDTGDSGVHVGTTAPSKSSKANVWINPEGSADISEVTFEFKEEGVNFTPTDNSIVAIYKKGTTAAIKNIVKIYVSGTEVALKSDIVDTSNFATKEEIPDTSEFITSEDLPDTSNFATKDVIPDTSGFATHDEIPDVSGLASTEYVNNSIDAVNAQIGLVNAELEEIINGGE